MSRTIGRRFCDHKLLILSTHQATSHRQCVSVMQLTHLQQKDRGLSTASLRVFRRRLYNARKVTVMMSFQFVTIKILSVWITAKKWILMYPSCSYLLRCIIIIFKYFIMQFLFQTFLYHLQEKVTHNTQSAPKIVSVFQALYRHFQALYHHYGCQVQLVSNDTRKIWMWFWFTWSTFEERFKWHLLQFRNCTEHVSVPPQMTELYSDHALHEQH